MADTLLPIVSFSSPPVAEVVTSVQFGPMPPEVYLSIGTLHAEKWRSDFPTLNQVGPYEPPRETFPGPGPVNMPFQITLAPQAPPMPRMWFISADGHQLLQVQPNWFAANWRANANPAPEPDTAAPYDRWTARRSAFLNHWETLHEWLRSAKVEVTPQQCEVTYINHLWPIEGVWARHGEIGHVLPSLTPHFSDGIVPEQVTYQATAEVRPDAELPASRLYLSVAPAFAPTPQGPTPIIVFELTVRGAPGEGELITFFDRARRVIVENFVRLTSSEARAAWGEQ